MVSLPSFAARMNDSESHSRSWESTVVCRKLARAGSRWASAPTSIRILVQISSRAWVTSDPLCEFSGGQPSGLCVNADVDRMIPGGGEQRCSATATASKRAAQRRRENPGGVNAHTERLAGGIESPQGVIATVIRWSQGGPPPLAPRRVRGGRAARSPRSGGWRPPRSAGWW